MGGPFSFISLSCEEKYKLSISSDLENSERFSYYIEKDTLDYGSVITKFLIELETFIQNEKLSENERKLGLALYDLFENYESIFIGNDNNKFNKNIVLLSLREMTNLSTKEIRSSMKKFKLIYLNLIQDLIK